MLIIFNAFLVETVVIFFILGENVSFPSSLSVSVQLPFNFQIAFLGPVVVNAFLFNLLTVYKNL